MFTIRPEQHGDAAAIRDVHTLAFQRENELLPQFGFQPAKTKGIEPPFPVPDEVFMVYEIKKGSLNDRSGKVKYPPAFDVVT